MYLLLKRERLRHHLHLSSLIISPYKIFFLKILFFSRVMLSFTETQQLASSTINTINVTVTTEDISNHLDILHTEGQFPSTELSLLLSIVLHNESKRMSSFFCKNYVVLNFFYQQFKKKTIKCFGIFGYIRNTRTKNTRSRPKMQEYPNEFYTTIPKYPGIRNIRSELE